MERTRQLDEGGTRFEMTDRRGRKRYGRFLDEGRTMFVIE